MSDDAIHVYSTVRQPFYKRRVVLSKRQCSCQFFAQYGIPCRHFIRALQSQKAIDSVFEYFDGY